MHVAPALTSPGCALHAAPILDGPEPMYPTHLDQGRHLMQHRSQNSWCRCSPGLDGAGPARGAVLDWTEKVPCVAQSWAGWNRHCMWHVSWIGWGEHHKQLASQAFCAGLVYHVPCAVWVNLRLRVSTGGWTMGLCGLYLLHHRPIILVLEMYFLCKGVMRQSIPACIIFWDPFRVKFTPQWDSSWPRHHDLWCI